MDKLIAGSSARRSHAFHPEVARIGVDCWDGLLERHLYLNEQAVEALDGYATWSMAVPLIAEAENP